MGIKAEILQERTWFMSHFGLWPNMLVIHPLCLTDLSYDQDYRRAALELPPGKLVAWHGMAVYVSCEVKRFRCALSVDDRDCA